MHLLIAPIRLMHVREYLSSMLYSDLTHLANVGEDSGSTVHMDVLHAGCACVWSMLGECGLLITWTRLYRLEL